ncbi:ParA family protein [Nocardia terpenica]|uniref:MinD/ParA family ATP-binding protein n=1 Tax=Nocardia terpenica TaxID=455432 RepID=UPI001894FD21|nr:ParA family protein [Nocardia terpenica]MBF6061997.1 ParA family protein [Nocardia terpenica]MBF6106203.1 ParA family protein [Nocardia terpenica]MBF6110417.1 ParA family protein [Nocardia terpenica]MBF6120746.1 ParA family protein [Nocardia terpenica]MBF6151753.1 ParA family protein [Nocardia terpenica]
MNEPSDTDEIASDREDYTAERPVDLRRQRLRPATAAEEDEPIPHDHATDPGRDAEAAQTVPDPYGVGADNLADTGPDAGEVAAVREARLAMLRHPTPGVETDPARWGWRGALNSLGMRWRPRRNSGEVAYRRAVERIRQPLAGTPLVVVANPKGGAGVTPAVVMLAALFGQHRGGQVVAWDTNESCGTLADRAAICTGPHTVWDVLGHARQLCSPNADASAVARFLHRQSTLEEVLGSDHEPGATRCIGAEECAAIWAVLRRHRSLIVADTGNNDRAEGFRWAIETATQLVVPVIGRRDVVVAALRLLDGIADTGRDDLASAAVIVLANGGDSAMAAQALSNAGVQRVITVPFDPVLASGERIVVPRLPRATIAAWAEVAATVADGIAESFAAHHAPLESEYVPETRWAPPLPEPTVVKQRRLLAYTLHENPAPTSAPRAEPTVEERGW